MAERQRLAMRRYRPRGRKSPSGRRRTRSQALLQSLKGTRLALMVIHNPVTLPPERRRRLSCLAAPLSGRRHPKRRPLLTRASNLYLDRLGPSFDMGVG
jgi:hypothetical protein